MKAEVPIKYAYFTGKINTIIWELPHSPTI